MQASPSALAARCRQLEAALEGASEFILFVGADGGVAFANGKVRRSLGHPDGAWTAFHIWDLDGALDRRQWAELQQELRDAGSLMFQASLGTREGVSLPVEFAAVHSDAGGEMTFLYGREPATGDVESGGHRLRQKVREETSRLAAINARLQTEIVDNMEAQKKLRESQERLELALWATKLGLWDWRIGTDRLLLDQGTDAVLGPGDSEERGIDSWRCRIHEQDLAGFDRKLQQHVEGGSDFFESTHRILQEDGSYRWYQAQGRAADRSDHEVARRMIGTLQDVSERKALEDELLQSQKLEAIGRLAGGVAHDFNNLLTAINGYSDLVLRSIEQGTQERAWVEEVRRAGQRASALTNRLLSFGRKQLHQPEPLDLAAVVRNLKPLLVPAVGEEVELLLDLAPVPLVRADLHQVEQALLNLVVNARDAVRENGRITIATGTAEPGSDEDDAAQPRVVLSVRDNGVGIDPQVRDHIFEPFFTTKARGDGSGLGLSMVYGIVRQCDGSVDVESELNRGTTIRLSFPVVEVTGTSRPERTELRLAEEREASGCVLLVEDEPAVRELLEQALADAGYSVTTVASAEAALEAIEKHGVEPDLLLSDVVLGGINGVELARMIRSTRPQARILFVSGYSESALDDQFPLDRGMAFLRKPFRIEVLLETVRELIEGAVPAAKR